MTPIEEQLQSLAGAEKAELLRIRSIVARLVPDFTEGLSYGMPAFKKDGRPLLAFQVRKEFLSLYPFSGWVVSTLRTELTDFEITPGSIHYSLEHPLPDSLLELIVQTRLHELEHGRH